MAIQLGKTIKQYRERAGLNRSELAKILGVTPASVSYWESDQKEPSAKAMIMMIKKPSLEE